MSEWQPIETAPKDGTTIIVHRAGHPDDYHTNVVPAFWGDVMAGYSTDDPRNYAWINWHEGLYETDDPDQPKRWHLVRNVTHWMPLPEPPQ